MSGLEVQQEQAGEELLAVVGSETFLAALPPLPISVAVAMQNLHYERSMHGHLHPKGWRKVLWDARPKKSLGFGSGILQSANRKVTKFGQLRYSNKDGVLQDPQ